jgi:hypothetical protein
MTFTGNVTSRLNLWGIAFDTGGAGGYTTHWIAPPGGLTAPTQSQNIQQLKTCIANAPAGGQCILAAGTYTIDATNPAIDINRSDIVVSGAGGMNDTKFVRGANYTDDLIRVGSTASVTGVVLRNFTVCGASNLWYNWQTPPTSAVGCPRVATDCAARTKQETQFPGSTGSTPQCADVRVVNSALPLQPADPFNSPPASYAVEFDHVDLEDATGHALVLRASPTTRVNDIYFHHGAINHSGVTGFLPGTDGIDYGRKFCDNYANYANATAIAAPRNLRFEYNAFTENLTGVTGALARWVSMKNNTFTRKYLFPQAQGGPPNDTWGGTLMFEKCSDQILLKQNTFVGPGTDHSFTQTLELYGRNITVDGNNMSGYARQTIAANSLLNANFLNNTISFNAPLNPDGGNYGHDDWSRRGVRDFSPRDL